MKRTSKNTHLAVNTVLILIGAFCLYFMSNFWIGTEEQHKELINNSGISFFFKKFAFNLIAIALIIGIIALLNRIFKNESIRKTIIYSFIILLIISAISIFISMN